MIGRENVEEHLYACLAASKPENMWVFVRKDIVGDALDLLKAQRCEYEKGFNDAMQDKRELMYEGIDGKWHKKDW